MLAAASAILNWILLDPLSVTPAILTPVPSPVAWSSSTQEVPALTEYCNVSSDARAVLKVAVSV